MPARVQAARTSQWLAALALAGGATTLAGWLLGVPELVDWFGVGIPQLPNNALATALAGLSLWLVAAQRGRAAALPAVAVLLLGALTLAEHVTGVDLGIDRVLLTRDWGLAMSSAPGRIGPPGSVAFTLLGASLLAALVERTRGAAALGSQAVIWVAMLSLIGYLLGAQPLYAVPRYTVISLQSTLMLVALAVGLLLSLQDRQPMRSILAPTASARLIRRVFPGILLVPVALAWVAVRGLDAGLYDHGFAISGVVLGVMIVLTALLWWSAAAVNEHEQRLQDSRGELAMSLAELEREDRRKNEFLATLAHELRNPLAPIRTGLAVLGRAGDDPQLSASTRAMMERQVQHMVRLIDDLLDLSRITRDRIELRLESVALRGVLEQSVEASAALVDAAGQTFIVDLPPAGVRVTGDPARLVQVFCNLLTNASKFTPAGGTITLAHELRGASVRVTVRDTGRGIPAARLDEIFDMFTQLSSPLDRHHGGLGIGLTLSRRLVQMHGGQLTAASEGEGKGSEFTVELPLVIARP